MRPISSNVVRSYRKKFLDATGSPLPGCEGRAALLLHVLTLLQEGRTRTATRLAWNNGLDLSQPLRIK